MKPETQQYFADQPKSTSDAKPFLLEWRGRSFKFYTDHGVFSKGELDRGTKVLLDALPKEFSGKFLDLGCGWGAVGLMIKAFNPDASITLCDVNQRAVSLARRNAKENRLSVDIFISDGMQNVTGSFDVIALNPPIRAGKETIYRLFKEAAEKLCEHGSLYIVIRKQQGADSAQKYLSTLFGSVCMVSREAGYHVFECKEYLIDAV